MPYELLQGGRRRRGRRRFSNRRRDPRLPALLAALALAVLAWFVATRGGDGGGRPASGRAAVATSIATRRTEPPPYASLRAPASERVSARLRPVPYSALLFDVDSGRVLWSRSPRRVLPIASLTKIMTALLVVQRSATADRVLITREALKYAGSGVGVLPRGKRVPLEALLYGLLLPSGNDAAIALAQHVADSVSAFVTQMNLRAHELGLRCTAFSSPDGFVDRGNHSCAQDLALLTRDVLASPRLARIVRSRVGVARFPIKGGKLFVYNNNPLIRQRYPGITGMKTGYTDAAGRCLIATAQRGAARLGVILLHSPDPASQARTLLDRGFAALRRTARG